MVPTSALGRFVPAAHRCLPAAVTKVSGEGVEGPAGVAEEPAVVDDPPATGAEDPLTAGAVEPGRVQDWPVPEREQREIASALLDVEPRLFWEVEPFDAVFALGAGTG